MLAVEPIGLGAGKEELAAVGVGAAVRHAEQPRAVVPKVEILVVKTLPVNGRSARSVLLQEVPALEHELPDHAVKRCVFVTHGVPRFRKFAGAKLPKVLYCFWDHVFKQLHLKQACTRSGNAARLRRRASLSHFDTASWDAGDGYVEEHDGVTLFNCL